MKRADKNVEKSRTVTRGYAKNLREQSKATMKTLSPPTWKHPRNNDDALILLNKRVEKVLAQRNDTTLRRTWNQLIRSNSTDFPVLLYFAAESLRLQSIRLVPNSEHFPNFRKALFHEPFSMDMETVLNKDEVEEINKDEAVETSSKVSSLSNSSSKRISARSQLNTTCNELFKQPMIYASTKHTENN